jgi:hypothetical protein
MEERLEIPLIFPEANPGPAGGEEPGRLLTATGLALAGVGRTRIGLSLMPPLMRERIELRRQRIYWAAAIATGALALSLLAADALSDRRILRAELHAREQELQQIEETRMEATRLREANLEFEQALIPARKSAASGRAVLDLLDMLSSAKHPDDWITLVADATAYYEPDPAQNTQPATRRAGAFLFVIEGYTPTEDLSTVRAMLDSIRRRSDVASADLLGDDRIREDRIRADRLLGKTLRRFAVEVTLWPR